MFLSAFKFIWFHLYYKSSIKKFKLLSSDGNSLTGKGCSDSKSVSCYHRLNINVSNSGFFVEVQRFGNNYFLSWYKHWFLQSQKFKILPGSHCRPCLFMNILHVNFENFFGWKSLATQFTFWWWEINRFVICMFFHNVTIQIGKFSKPFATKVTRKRFFFLEMYSWKVRLHVWFYSKWLPTSFTWKSFSICITVTS